MDPHILLMSNLHWEVEVVMLEMALESLVENEKGKL